MTKLDRLARSVANFLEIQKFLAEKSVNLRILDLNLNTSTPMGEMVLGVLAYVAQFERKIMLEHQRVGIAKAKSEGKFRGRPKNEKLLKRMDAEISAYDRSDPRSLTIKQIAEKLGISYVYVYRRMKQVAPEKIRHRTLKRDIIEKVFDSDEESYSATVFPNLEQLEITDDDLKIVTKKKPFKKLKMLKVTNSVKNLDELIKALSKTPNLEELILINTGIIQKLVRIADKLIDLPLIKKVTLQEKELTEIPDPLLILPNIEQITIGEKTYFKTDLEKERSSRHISIISYDDKKNLIQDVKEGRLDAVKQKIKEIDFLDIREDLSKIAVSGGHTEVLKLLLNNRVDINARYEDGNTLLMEASKKGYFDIVKLLIDRGANVKEKNKEGKTAFSLAFDLAKSESHRHKKDKKWIKVIKLLGNNGADLNEKDESEQSFLYSAIVWNNVDLVKALLDAANTKNVLSTLISSHKNKVPLTNKQITEFRESSVIDVNEKFNLNFVKKALRGKTLLMYATNENYREIVELLLDHGANTEERDNDGNTAIMQWGDIKTVEILLNHGADPFIKNEQKETALSLAEHVIEGRWIDRVKDGAKKIIEKIKSHKGYKDFKKAQNSH